MPPLYAAFWSFMAFPLWASGALVDLCRMQREHAAAVGRLCAAVAGGPGLGSAPLPAREAELFVGKSVTKQKTVSDIHTLWFGFLSLDFNPLHFNEAAARQSRFQGRIAHGLHTASLFTGVLAELTPWCAYLHQDIDFTAPVRPGDTLTASGTIEEISAKGVVQVGLVCRNQAGQIVVRGRALVKKLGEMFEEPPAPAGEGASGGVGGR
jgi:3-hydroxybutyryl-CoA dehydratase